MPDFQTISLNLCMCEWVVGSRCSASPPSAWCWGHRALAGEGSLLVCLKAVLSGWFYWPGRAAPRSPMEVMHGTACGTRIAATWGNWGCPRKDGPAVAWVGGMSPGQLAALQGACSQGKT